VLTLQKSLIKTKLLGSANASKKFNQNNNQFGSVTSFVLTQLFLKVELNPH